MKTNTWMQIESKSEELRKELTMMGLNLVEAELSQYGNVSSFVIESNGRKMKIGNVPNVFKIKPETKEVWQVRGKLGNVEIIRNFPKNDAGWNEAYEMQKRLNTARFETDKEFEVNIMEIEVAE